MAAAMQQILLLDFIPFLPITHDQAILLTKYAERHSNHSRNAKTKQLEENRYVTKAKKLGSQAMQIMQHLKVCLHCPITFVSSQYP